MVKELELIALFEQFIKDSYTGRRLGPNGQRIKPQTVENYRYVLKLLAEFTGSTGFQLKIKPINHLNKRELQVEKNYWRKFYRSFTEFLYREKGYFDNYVGSVIKNIRTFFGYLNREKLIPTGDFYKSFHVKTEDISIITLMPEQLQFLINDKAFCESLPKYLTHTKNVCVFGCTVALRFSDLFNIRFRDIEQVNGSHYLAVRSLKTSVVTRVKLPEYAVAIVNNYRKRKDTPAKIFTSISKNQFNRNLRLLARKAGWTNEIGKHRNRNGQSKEVYKLEDKRVYQFCDLMSSHVMRRTAITTMLMLGMPENIVRKISGHTANSKAFYRYVNFVQSYIDQEIDKVHNKLSSVQG